MHETKEYQFELKRTIGEELIKFPIFNKNSSLNKEYVSPTKPSFKKEIDKKDSHGELTCTAASLRGHIVRAHFDPYIMADFGVARYDIDLAKYRGFNLDWVVSQAYKRLEESPEMTKRRFGAYRLWGTTSMKNKERYFEYEDIEGYKEMLVKTLRHIAEQGLTTVPVDWNRVALSVPNLEGITLDIERDSRERPFTESHRFVAVK